MPPDTERDPGARQLRSRSVPDDGALMAEEVARGGAGPVSDGVQPPGDRPAGRDGQPHRDLPVRIELAAGRTLRVDIDSDTGIR